MCINTTVSLGFCCLLAFGIFGGVARVAIAINTVRSGLLYKHWYFRLADCVLVATVTAVVLCTLPACTTCLRFPYKSSACSDDHRRLGGTASSRNYNQYSCDDTYYSPMASLSCLERRPSSGTPFSGLREHRHQPCYCSWFSMCLSPHYHGTSRGICCALVVVGQLTRSHHRGGGRGLE